MARYNITYTNPEATYPAPVHVRSIDAENPVAAWAQAKELGFVRTIFDLDACHMLFSRAWSFNFLGLDQKELEQW